MCKDNSKCLSFEYDNKKKTCKFSKSCHKDSNFIGRQPITNIIYTKKGGKQPAKSNYDIYKNKKLLNYKMNYELTHYFQEKLMVMIVLLKSMLEPVEQRVRIGHRYFQECIVDG